MKLKNFLMKTEHNLHAFYLLTDRHLKKQI